MFFVELLFGINEDSIDDELLVLSGELLAVEPLDSKPALFGRSSGEELFESLFAVADLANPFGRLLRLLHLIGPALTALQYSELLSHRTGRRSPERTDSDSVAGLVSGQSARV